MSNLPKEWQIKICAGNLNSFIHLPMTDCSFTFDHHLKEERNVETSLACIETSSDLFELYLSLNPNGVHNITRWFSKTFDRIEKLHNETVELNIWDFRLTKKLFY